MISSPLTTMNFKNIIFALLITLSPSITFARSIPPTLKNPDESTKNTVQQNTTKSPKDSELTQILEKVQKALINNQFASALSLIDKALKLKPNELELLLLCTLTAQKAEDHNKALECIELAKQKHPNSPKLKQLCFYEAISHTKFENWDKATKAYLSCESNTPTEKSAISSNLAEIYMAQGQTQMAIDEYKKSIALAPNNIHALFGIAVALQRIDKPKESRLFLQIALSKDPTISFLKDAFFIPKGEEYFHKAIFSHERGKMKNAIYWLEKYLQTQQIPQHLETAKKLLNQYKKLPDPRINTFPTPSPYPSAANTDPSLNLLAIGTLQGRLSTVNLKTNKITNYLNENDIGEAISDLAFTPDAKKIRAISQKHYYEIDLTDPNNTILILPLTQYTPIDLAADASYALVAADDTIFRLDLNNFKSQKPIFMTKPNVAAAITPDSKSIATATGIGIISDLKTRETKAAFDSNFMIVKFDAHPTKNIFATASNKGAAIFSDDATLLKALESPDKPLASSIAFDPSGKYLTIAYETVIEIWNFEQLIN